MKISDRYKRALNKVFRTSEDYKKFVFSGKTLNLNELLNLDKALNDAVQELNQVSNDERLLNPTK